MTKSDRDIVEMWQIRQRCCRDDVIKSGKDAVEVSDKVRETFCGDDVTTSGRDGVKVK